MIDFGGPWPHMVGVSFIIQGIPYVICYIMKYDLMYKSIIFSRLLNLVYYVVSVFHLKHASFTLIMTLGAFEVFWVIVAFLLVLNRSHMKDVPSKITLSNVQAPHIVFTLVSASVALLEALGCLIVPDIWCDIIGQRSPPLVNLYIRWYGFMQLLTLFFVHIKARSKSCNMIIFAHEAISRVIWVIAVVLLMYHNEIMLVSTNTAMYIIYNNSMIMWALFEMRRRIVDPSTLKFTQ
jgi:hypothetical protein